jgi:subtilase family serine protease
VLLICSFLITAYYQPPIIVQTPSTLTLQEVEQLTAEPLSTMEPLAGSSAGSGYTPSQMKTAYNMPSSGGSGATIAIIVAYDTPNIETYLSVFCQEFSLPAPDGSNFEVHKMTNNYAVDPTGKWSPETCLDVEWAHAIAPQAKILLVEAVDSRLSQLRAAIDYATSRPDVVAVSISAGFEESQLASWFTYFDSSFTKPGIAYFASSGDSGEHVLWPACSPYVIAVGGTVLNLNADGTVNSENAWEKSGGGVSAYEDMPTCQSNYGLPGTKRIVPDVSYSASHLPVYSNNGWSESVGTSNGAPQWAAIYALDRSATLGNIYHIAKTAYASSFRDITNGANNGSSAGTGYDYVTGLGSPITTNFDFALTVTPSQGTGSGPITVSGTDFTAGSTVKIEYLNPQSASWISVVNNYPIETEDFTFTTTAPDLQLNNAAGDHSSLYDNIVYRATDNSNSRTVTTAVPYKEWRRGLTQVGMTAATGIFGPNSLLSTIISGVDEQTFTITSKWFKPGTATMTWDNTENLGTTTIDATGRFTATVTASASITETHTVTINDGTYDFSFDLTFYAIPNPVPEGPEISMLAAVFCAAMLVLLVKRKQK